MDKLKIMILIPALLLISCSASKSEPDSMVQTTSETVVPYVQEQEQLYIETSAPDDNTAYSPLNYDNQTGIWYPYMDYEEYMYGKSEEAFREHVRSMLNDAKEQQFNTIYVHVRACGDAYYSSEIFPRGKLYDGDYDPLEIFLEEGHQLGLSVHAWINPLRCQTVEEFKQLPDDFIVKQWTENNTGSLVGIVNGRYYLNPAYEETINLICQGVNEIISNYNVDGIHIDDYFYPTTDPEFDKSAFEASGSTDLSKWRMENCSRMVRSIYESVKSSDKDILFGISPQGNINANYSSQYADVRLWGSCEGYCDYIVPQIYFGFKNEACPFEKTLHDWEELVSCENVSLIIGLGAYKLGNEDKWAGAAGEQEWIENDDIIEKQKELVNASSANGYAIYF